MLAVSSVATVLFAVAPCPAERVVSSFLSVVVEAVSAALFAGVAASNFGVAAVGVAAVAEAAVLVLLASLVEAGAVEVDAAVTAGLASYVVATVLVVSEVDAAEVAVEVAGVSDAVATAATLSLVVSVFSYAAALAEVPTMTSVPKSTEQTPRFNLRIENLLIRSLNKSFPNLIGLHLYLLINFLIVIVLFFKTLSILTKTERYLKHFNSKMSKNF